MTTATATPKTKSTSFRLIFRGKNKAGKYMRAVRHVKADTQAQAYEILAAQGAILEKEMPFVAAYTNVFCPLADIVTVAAPVAA